MPWFDWMTLAILLAFGLLQAIRSSKAGGMGLALFEAVGIVAAAFAAVHLAGPLAESMHMQKSTVMIGMFFLLCVGAFFLGRWLFSITGWSFQTLDGPLGFIFGVVTGWAVAHMVLRVIIESQGWAGPVASQMQGSIFAREIMEFRGWHWLMRVLFRAKSGGRSMWNVDEHGL